MNISKRVLAATTCALAAVFASTIAHADGLLKPGHLKVGMEISYPPFESYDNGKVVGFDPEISRLLAAQMGDEVEFVDTKFSGLILGLKANKIDTIISGMYITPPRVKQADAFPYARTGAYIMVLKNASVRPTTKEELCGLKVGLEQGTTWVQALNKLSSSYCEANGKKPITVLEFPSAPEVTTALMSHNVEAQLEIAGAAKMFEKRTHHRVEVSSPDLVYPQTLGIYVKQGNDELKTQLQSALNALKANGSYAALLKKYDLQPVE